MEAWKMQNDIFSKLLSSVKDNKILNAYLLEGRRGIGKYEVAINFAKAILCENYFSDTNCNICKRIESNNYSDLIVIEPKNGKYTVDDARNIVNSAFEMPFESKRKVYIIKNFDVFEILAQNMLLKILEEPPEFCVFILCVENQERVLPTILSRTSNFKLKNIDYSNLSNILTNEYQIDKDKSKYLSYFSGGALSYAIELYNDTDFFINKKMIIELVSKILYGYEEYIIDLGDLLEANKEKVEQFLDIILFYLRDLKVYFSTGNFEYVIDVQSKTYINKLNSNINLDSKIFAIEEIKRHIKSNVSIKNAFYALF